MKPEAYAGIYGEIAEQYNQEYVRSFIRENSGQYTIRELSVRFGYSDRRIRQFLSEEKQVRCKQVK